MGQHSLFFAYITLSEQNKKEIPLIFPFFPPDFKSCRMDCIAYITLREGFFAPNNHPFLLVPYTCMCIYIYIYLYICIYIHIYMVLCMGRQSLRIAYIMSSEEAFAKNPKKNPS